MIKCIIVEDETLAQQVIQRHLEKIYNCELVAVCNNVPEAKQALDKHDVDLMFLDIQLPGMTGLHFLRFLQNPPLVVITTAYAAYAVESYEYNIIDYLLKPVSFDRFSKSINKIVDSGLATSSVLEKENTIADHFFVKGNGKFFKVNFSEINYIEGKKDYVKIHAADFSLLTLQTMMEMEKILPPNQFLRVHKSYIIALGNIKSIYGNSIEVGNETIPIGLNFKNKVLELINKK